MELMNEIIRKVVEVPTEKKIMKNILDVW